MTGGAGAGETGIRNGTLLLEFAEAVIAGDPDRLDRARAAVMQTMGAAALVDAAGVVGLFNAIDRVADATGTPLEASKAEQSEELRDQLRINEFAKTKATLEDSGTMGSTHV